MCDSTALALPSLTWQEAITANLLSSATSTFLAERWNPPSKQWKADTPGELGGGIPRSGLTWNTEPRLHIRKDQWDFRFILDKVLSASSMVGLHVLAQTSPPPWSLPQLQHSLRYTKSLNSFCLHIHFILDDWAELFSVFRVYLFSMSQLYTSLGQQLSPAQNRVWHPIARKQILCD